MKKERIFCAFVLVMAFIVCFVSCSKNNTTTVENAAEKNDNQESDTSVGKFVSIKLDTGEIFSVMDVGEGEFLDGRRMIIVNKGQLIRYSDKSGKEFFGKDAKEKSGIKDIIGSIKSIEFLKNDGKYIRIESIEEIGGEYESGNSYYEGSIQVHAVSKRGKYEVVQIDIPEDIIAANIPVQKTPQTNSSNSSNSSNNNNQQDIIHVDTVYSIGGLNYRGSYEYDKKQKALTMVRDGDKTYTGRENVKNAGYSMKRGNFTGTTVVMLDDDTLLTFKFTKKDSGNFSIKVDMSDVGTADLVWEGSFTVRK